VLDCESFRFVRLTRDFPHDHYGVRAEGITGRARHGTRQVGSLSGRDEDEERDRVGHLGIERSDFLLRSIGWRYWGRPAAMPT
jgi:hypothetical protein